ncbi:hypothetical protein BDF22DRAFT_666390 [Syncephalis plumigaleata]|nr:hypothetical protein BDF22DRAFT_666390 [Syncephalis plumigaleata]
MYSTILGIQLLFLLLIIVTVVEQNLPSLRHYASYPCRVKLNIPDWRAYCTGYRVEHKYSCISAKKVYEPINASYSTRTITLPVHITVKHWRTFIALHQYLDPRRNTIASIQLALSLLVWSINSIALQTIGDHPINIERSNDSPVIVIDLRVIGEQYHEVFWRLSIDLAWSRRMAVLYAQQSVITFTGVYYSVLGGRTDRHHAYQAGQLARRQIELARQLGYPSLECRCLAYYAEFHIQIKRYKRAAQLIQQAWLLYQRTPGMESTLPSSYLRS